MGKQWEAANQKRCFTTELTEIEQSGDAIHEINESRRGLVCNFSFNENKCFSDLQCTIHVSFIIMIHVYMYIVYIYYIDIHIHIYILCICVYCFISLLLLAFYGLILAPRGGDWKGSSFVRGETGSEGLEVLPRADGDI